MSLERTTAPAAIMTLADAKAQLRVDHTDDDALITSLIAVVADVIDGLDGALGKAMITQQWTYSSMRPFDRLEIPLTPVQSVESITYLDPAEEVQTLTVADYILHKDQDEAYLVPKTGKAWPSMADRPDAITVAFTAGYGDAADVPASIIHAAKMLLSHYYENRETVLVGTISKEIEFGLNNLLSRHKKGWIGA